MQPTPRERFSFCRSYTDPVVIAQPPSFNGGQAVAVRIVDFRPDGFTVKLQEPHRLDGGHLFETVHWIVVERGSWGLPDGTRFEVGKLDTSATVGTRVGANFASTPDLRVRATGSGLAHHTYLRFQVSGIPSPILSARLRIRTRGATLPSAPFFRIFTTNWSENTITWNNAPLDAGNQVVLGPLAANTWHEIDVGTLVTGNGTFTLGGVSADQPGLAYYSREAGFPASLEITYQP
ncbi:MAG: DNRLRE domain-containing protein [Holophagales bacterium]|nr:DNRLRE domain-containing protein [Holophagales bacterium]